MYVSNPLYRILAHTLVTCGVLLLASAVRAEDNHHVLASRDRVSGDLVAGERDSLAFEATSGTVVQAKLRFEGQGTPTLRLYGPAGVLTTELRASARSLSLSKIELTSSGMHTFVVSADGPLTYEFQWKVRVPRRVTVQGNDATGTGSLVEFEAHGPGEIALAARGSGNFVPRILEVADATERVKVALSVTDVRESNAGTRLRFRAERPGTYCVMIQDPEGDPGAFELRVRMREDRPARRDVDLLGDPAPLGAFDARGVPVYETYASLHRLAELEPDARAFQESSFDRIGGNDDGLSGNFVALHQDVNGEFVVFDQLGPGVITRIHYAFRSTVGLPVELYRPNAEDYDVRFYFDDEVTPRISMPVRDFVSGTVAPFLAPAVGDDIASPGGPYVYVPIPFEHRVKVTTTALGHYWQIGYELYDDATNVTSFDPLDPLVDDLNALLSAPGSDPHGGRAFASRHAASVDVPVAGSAQVFSLRTEGWIDTLVFEPLDQVTRDELSNTVLRIWFDDHAQADVDCRLDLFFGSGLGEASVQGILFAMDVGGTLRCSWPMPFADSCRIELVNQAATSLAYAVTTYYHPIPYGGDWGYFRGRAREVQAPPLMEWPNLQDYIIFDVAGRGHVVGLSLTVGSDGLLGSPQPRTYLEGDEHVWIDGARTPTHHGTGTEETFNWGWYSAPFTVPFTVPFHGLSARLIDGTRDYTANWRVLIGDRIPFRSSLRFGFEQGAEGFEGANYSGVAFAYVKEETAMVESDVFDVGNLTSESQHAYSSPGGLLLQPLTSQFETQRLEPDHLDGGRVESGSHSFRVQVDPANRGVILRRILDQGEAAFARRRGRVYVDGRYVRDWYNARWNVWRRFLEDEFQIGESFTAGKSSLVIRIEPTEGTWNAYRYTALSVLH